ncbi:MAG: hypothetical protein AB2A00_15755 [Myxococcota bacterium]
MNALRIRPVRRILLCALLCLAVAVGATAEMLRQDFGRREAGPDHPLPSALRGLATVENLRLQTALRGATSNVDALLTEVLRASPEVDPQAAVPWTPGLCDVAWPQAVVRAGLVDVSAPAPLSLVELPGGKCLDRVGMQAFQALSGPPFPSAVDVARVALMALSATDMAKHNTTLPILAYRDGNRAVVRLARRQFARVAWADLRMDSLPAPPVLEGARLDSLMMLDGVPVGYVHGGPERGALKGAFDDVKSGKTRALDLHGVAQASSAQGVVAHLYPALDDGRLALGSASAMVDTPVGRLDIMTVAATPWPAHPARLLPRLVVITGGAALVLLVLAMLLARRMGGALWRTAGHVREAWLGLREDDVDSEEDRRRATVLLQGLSDGTRATLEAAYGKGERFWAPAPVGRLLDLVKRKLQGP